MKNWSDNIEKFIMLSDKYDVRFLMVGGGAVNFHGYQRHSADVDFWIDTSEENLNRLILVFQQMGYDIDEFPKEIKEQNQNISVKFSPAELEIELITRFSINKTFEEAYIDSQEVMLHGMSIAKYRVLSLEDLITSKVKSGRPKDLLDIMELKRINNPENEP